MPGDQNKPVIMLATALQYELSNLVDQTMLLVTVLVHNTLSLFSLAQRTVIIGGLT